MNSEAAVHQKPLTRLPDSFDSPVIYGVRVETPNPYHLLISKHYIQNGNQRVNRMEKRLTFGGRFLMMRRQSETDKEREES